MKKSYFSIIAGLCLFFLAFLNINNANAAIYFISKTDNSVSQDNTKPCSILGYKYTLSQCESHGKKLIDLCPTDAKYG